MPPARNADFLDDAAECSDDTGDEDEPIAPENDEDRRFIASEDEVEAPTFGPRMLLEDEMELHGQGEFDHMFAHVIEDWHRRGPAPRKKPRKNGRKTAAARPRPVPETAPAAPSSDRSQSAPSVLDLYERRRAAPRRNPASERPESEKPDSGNDRAPATAPSRPAPEAAPAAQSERVGPHPSPLDTYQVWLRSHRGNRGRKRTIAPAAAPTREPGVAPPGTIGQLIGARRSRSRRAPEYSVSNTEPRVRVL